MEPRLVWIIASIGLVALTIFIFKVQTLKTWLVWTLLVVGIIGLIFFAYALNKALPVEWCFYITVGLNGIVTCYLLLQKYNRKSEE